MRWTLATTRTRSLMVNCGTFRVTRDADVDRVLSFAVVVVGAFQGRVMALPLARRTYRLDLLYPDRQDHVMTAAVQVNKLGPRLVLMCRPVLRCSHLFGRNFAQSCPPASRSRILLSELHPAPDDATYDAIASELQYSLDADAHAVRLARRANDLDPADPDPRRGVDSGLLKSRHRTTLLPQMPSGTTGVAKPITFQAWIFARPATSLAGACKSAYLHVRRHLYCLVTTRAATPVF
jgi:hypothetical protein